MSKSEQEVNIEFWNDEVQNWVSADMDTSDALVQTESSLRHFMDYLERKNIDSVSDCTTDDITNYIKILQSTYTDISLYNMYRHLEVYFDAIHSLGYVAKNILAETEREDSKNIDPEAWSTANPKKVKEQGESVIELETKKIDKMVRACDNVRDKVIIRLLQDTGLRASELTNIKLNQIEEEWEDNKIIEVLTAKRDGHERSVFYTDRTSVLLTEYLDGGGRSKYTTAEDSEYLLVSLRSKKIHPNWLNRIVRESAEKAGVQEVMFTDAKGHDRYRYTAQHFRSNFAIKSVKNGMPIEFLRRILGHADLDTTKEAYLGFRDSDLRDAYNRYYS